MADISKKIIEIDPGNSIRTMKELRDETNKYREALLNLEEGSEEYIALSRKIAQNQETISRVMGASKKYTDDAAGSYNALVKEMARLKETWKATADEVERAALGEKINSINNELKEMDASIGNYQRNVGNYSSVWGGLAESLGEMSQIGNDAADGFEGLGAALGLAGQAGEAFNSSLNRSKAIFKMGESIGKVTKGLKEYVAASVAAAKAEKERIISEKAMAKATNASTIATKAATVATKAFGVALKAIGIGLILSLVAALTANMDHLKKSLGPLIDRFDDFGKKVKNVLREVVAGFVGAGTVVVEVFAHLDKVWYVAAENFKLIWGGMFDWFKEKFEILGKTFELSQGPGGIIAATTYLVGSWKKSNDDIVDSFKQAQENLEELLFKELDIKGAFKQGQEAGRIFFDSFKTKVEDIKGTETGEVKVPVVIDYSKLKVDTSKIDAALQGDTQNILAQRMAEAYKNDYAQQLIDLETEREDVLEAFKGTEEQKLALIELYGQKENELRDKIYEQATKDLQDNLDAQVALETEAIKATQKRKDQQTMMYGAIGETLGNIGDLFEEDTIAYKAMAVSQALISTFLAGTKVMAEEMGPWYVKVAAMAAVITAGLSTVAKIVSVKPDGENSATSASAPNTAAAIPVIGNGSNISYTRQLTTAAEEDEMNKPIWVSVTDINNVQNKVRVVEENASF